MPAPLPACSHRPPCPGCPRYGESGWPSEALEAIEGLARDAGLPAPELRRGRVLGHRHRARLAVRGRAASPKVGIFQQGSHRIVDIPRCGVHHEGINLAAAALKAALRSTGIAPYAERPHVGVLRTLQVVVERRTQRLQLVLVANAPSPASVEPLVEPLCDALGERLHSLWWNGNPERTNTILGPSWERLYGEAMLRESVAGAEVQFPPGAFGQSHPELAEKMVAYIHERVAGGRRVAELYAGCGAIGLGLSERCRQLRLNEIDAYALEGLRAGVRALPAAQRARVEVLPGSAGERLDALEEVDCAIVDPPRRGLDPALLEQLHSRPPRQLVYVSCGLPSFLRDCARLREHGRLELTELSAWDLFPHTAHVEVVAGFEAR